MQKRFERKWVLITGAGGGLGQAFAERFAAEGASLLLTDVDKDSVERVASQLRERAGACHALAADLSAESDIQRLASVVQTHCARLDVLVNNAGIAYGKAAYSFEQLSQAQWLKILSINALAPLLLAQALRPLLAAAGGAVINISSMASFMPGNAYGVSKAALNAMTYGMAAALGGDRIRVNAIAPGIVETNAAVENLPAETFKRVQTQQMVGQQIVPSDIAELAAFLASDAARGITCEIVSCDAGNRMRGWR